MERRIPVTNNTQMPIYVGSNMIPAGETRDLPESQVPAHHRPREEPPEPPAAPDDPYTTLLEHNVGTVVAALPAMSVEEIEKLGELEQLGQARKGVLSAIAEALLKRASNPAADAAPAAEDGAK